MLATLPALATKTPLAINKLELEKSILKDSFFDFFIRFWSTISPEPLVANWHIKILCDELQAVMERVFLRLPKEHDLVINIPPGSTKSSICSVALPAWCWTRDPTLKIICGSHGYDLSLDFAGKCRRVILSEKYQKLFPEVELVSSGKEELENSQGGVRIATSVGTAPTGKHAHVHIFDDLLDVKKALSETSLKECRDWVMQVMPSRVIRADMTPAILLMQRVAIGDPTDVVFERAAQGGAKCRFICLPAEVSLLVRPRALRKQYVEGLLDPIRLPRAVLATKRAELGQYAYAGQYDQRPVPAGGGMFRTSAVPILLAAPTHYSRIVRYWDKSGTDKGGAWTVGVLMCKIKESGTNHFRYVVLDVVRGQWEAAERERVIKQTAEMDGRKVPIGIEQEPGSGGKESAQATVRGLAGWRVRKDRPVGNKVARADAFATQVNDGNVSIVRAPWNAAYLQELSLFWFGPFKDQVDASSGAFNQLVALFKVGAI